MIKRLFILILLSGLYFTSFSQEDPIVHQGTFKKGKFGMSSNLYKPDSWENITGVGFLKLKRFNSYFIVLKLMDTDKYLASRNFLIRWILKKYLKLYGGIVLISDRRIDYDINQLKKEIVERCVFSV